MLTLLHCNRAHWTPGAIPAVLPRAIGTLCRCYDEFWAYDYEGGRFESPDRAMLIRVRVS